MTDRINPRTKKKYYYKDNPKSVRKRDAQRMYICGKEISKKHPLHRPGRYKSFEDAWSHNKLDQVTEGHVYAITNPAWPDWVKIGMAVDAKDRLRSYQTASPMRDFELALYVESKNKRKAEALAHSICDTICEDRNGEWFKMPLDAAMGVIRGLEVLAEHFDQETLSLPPKASRPSALRQLDSQPG